MVTTIPSRVSPLPGWNGPIVKHGGVESGGSDLMVTPGVIQPIDSITNGTVVFISTQQTAPTSGGNSIEIKGTDGLYYYFAHMKDAPAFKVGDVVKAGQQIGIVGSTGNASPSAPHLHIGIGHSISTGVGASGGVGTGFDAVALLKDLQARANIPDLAKPEVQAQIANTQAAGTISIKPAASPVTQSLTDRILWLTDLLRHAGVNPTQIPTLVAISLAENNSSDPNSVSPTGDWGLWQINWDSWKNALAAIGITSKEQLKDPVTNSQAAAFVLANQGLNAWTTYKQGVYTKYTQAVSDALSGVDLTNPGDTSNGGDTTTTPDCNATCPKWVLMDKPHVEIPDLGCVAVCQMGIFVEEWKKRWLTFWSHWTYETGYNYAMIVFGVVIIALALVQIAGETVPSVATQIIEKGL